jgi:predicted metalloendopeptidase
MQQAAFATAFGCKAGNPMWHAPDARITVFP